MSRRTRPGTARLLAVVLAALIAATVGACGSDGEPVHRPPRPSPTPAPNPSPSSSPDPRPTTAACQVSVSRTLVPSCGAWWGGVPARHGKEGIDRSVARQEARDGRRMDLVRTYHTFWEAFPTAAERRLTARGHLVVADWETTWGTTRVSWREIATGRLDHVIDAEARRLAAFGAPIMLSFAHEPELSLGATARPRDFVAAYRHVHDRVVAAGATNVVWVWDVVGLTRPQDAATYRELYPGNAFVDWVAWDPYNWASCRQVPWRDPMGVVAPFAKLLQDNRIGQGKPFMLAEYGSVLGRPSTAPAESRPRWLAQVAEQAGALPRVKAWLYFDVDSPPASCDWRLTDPASRSAFALLGRSGPFAATAQVDLSDLLANGG